MKAEETSLKILSRQEQQYVVPLFQRPYSWGRKPEGTKPWDDLWDDLYNLFEESDDQSKSLKTHFLGSIVTIPAEQMPQHISKFTLIDGQQRLTTLSILLAVIRDMTPNKQLKDQIEKYHLVNEYEEGDDRYKLLPTQQDRSAFRVVIDKKQLGGTFGDAEDTLIVGCYRFFEKKLKKEKVVNLEKLYRIIVNQLTVVSIALSANENPHSIFESLNASGTKLTQADLIRNYFLMRFPVNEQEEIFEQYWQPMQKDLGENLTEFMRHYLMAMNPSFVKEKEVYFTLKKYVETPESQRTVLDSLKEVATYAEFYRRILDPINEPESFIRQALGRIKRLKITVAYPFLLRCYYDYSQRILNAQEFVDVLYLIENFVIRRSVCNVPSHGLNKLFPLVYGQVRFDEDNGNQTFTRSVANFLQSKDYPDDSEFRNFLTDSKTRFYTNSEGKERTKLILESLELCYEHKEPISDFGKYTIEHVMPQTLNDWWKQHLGSEYEEVHKTYLHVLGNLTLTGYNSELSNKSFFEKQRELALSHLELNRYFANVSEWKKEQIESRAKHLANFALNKWAYFGDEKHSTAQVKTGEVQGTKPILLKFKDQKIPVKTWKEVLIKTLDCIFKEQPDIFEQLASEYPKSLGRDANVCVRCAPLKNGYFVETNLSAKQIYSFCQKVMDSCGYTREEWQIDYE